MTGNGEVGNFEAKILQRSASLTIQALDFFRSMDELRFDEFAKFVREFWHVSSRKPITPDTQFERDLGLTGDDGDELLQATQRRFGVQLGSEETGIRETFNLGPNEYLFQSEGWEMFPSRLSTLFGAGDEYTVRMFTVGELFEAVLNTRGKHGEANKRHCDDPTLT